jgi:S-adenosylmethionine hydrolase
MKVATFLTDFGVLDGYVAQMKGVILSQVDARLVDITHDVASYDIRGGAFILQSVVPFFPVGTVHVAVVDPGVGTDRRGIIVITRDYVLVGPDNGLLIPAARRLKDFTVYEISDEKNMHSSVSSTFHGRDIFAPVVARILKGVPFDELGFPVEQFVDLDFGQAEMTPSGIVGQVIHVDRFGNVITNITGVQLVDVVSFDTKIRVGIGNRSMNVPFVRSYGYVKKGMMLGTIGGSGYFEIGVNQGNAARKLQVTSGDVLWVAVG